MILALRSRSRGYAMATFVLVMAIVGTLTLVIVSTSLAEQKASRRLLTSSESRSMATSALDAFYAQVLSDTSGRLLERSGTDPLNPYQAPLVDPDPSKAGDQLWVTLRDGKVVSDPCDLDDAERFDRTAVCYTLVLKDQSVIGAISTSQRSLNTVVVEVTTRTRCDEFLTQGAATGCEYTRFQQRLRKQQFFDFIFYTQFSALDPERYADLPGYSSFGALPEGKTLVDVAHERCGERYATRKNLNPLEEPADDVSGSRASRSEVSEDSCIEVAYQGSGGDNTNPNASGPARDVINGPLYTNDDRILVCGTPLFKETVFVSGSGAADKPYVRASDTPGAGSCDGDPELEGNPRPLGYDLDQPDIALPTLSNLGELRDLPGYRRAASGSGGPVEIVLAGPRVTATAPGGASASFDISPETGNVLVVEGDATLRSAGAGLEGRLSILATGNINIVDDVVYKGGPSSTNYTDVLALNALGSIVIDQMDPDTHTRQELDRGRTIHAIMVSLKNAVYVNGWSAPAEQQNNANRERAAAFSLPPLHFYGAMAARYQGIFGGYDANSGDLVSGYHKEFEYDDRLSRNLVSAPYLISPKVAQWIRTDVSEVAPCTGTFNECFKG